MADLYPQSEQLAALLQYLEFCCKTLVTEEVSLTLSPCQWMACIAIYIYSLLIEDALTMRNQSYLHAWFEKPTGFI